MSDKYDKLEKLNKLRDQGVVTEEEFQQMLNDIGDFDNEFGSINFLVFLNFS